MIKTINAPDEGPVLSDERWTPVAGFEGLYSVSDHGRVRSEPRIVPVAGSRGHTPHARTIRSCILSPTANPGGYPTVKLYRSGSQHTFMVHHLVLEGFIGPSGGLVCRHLDGNRTNNHVDNIKWGTVLENAHDKLRHGTQVRGVLQGSSKLNPRLVRDARRRYSDGESFSIIAADMGVGTDTIRRAVTGKTWAHVPGVVNARLSTHHCQKLSAQDVAAIRRTEGPAHMAAATHNVSPSLIRAIRRGEVWT